MTDQNIAHLVTIELREPVASEAPVGCDIELIIAATCQAGCNLSGTSLIVTGPDGSAIHAELAGREDSRDQAGPLRIITPTEVGEHFWTIRIPAGTIEGHHHAEAVLPIGIRTKPHASSLAVWDIPSPVIMGERFRMKVGAKSAAGADLADTQVAICDSHGREIAHGRLGTEPWPGTKALYWIELEPTACLVAGMHTWTVKFTPTNLEVPHDGSSTDIHVVVAPRPECQLTVKVFDQDSAHPIEQAQVRLGAFRAETDRAGMAQVELPKGSYELIVWKVGYEVPIRKLDIDQDITHEVGLVAADEYDPESSWEM
jgi:hypothetical protein